MRLFVAVDIDPALRRAVAEMQENLWAPGLGMVPTENLHVTLQFLGEVDEGKVDSIRERLSTIRMEPFMIGLAELGAFPSLSYIRVVWIGMSGPIKMLADKVRHALPEFPEGHPFSAHLTIARVKGRVPGLADNLLKLQNIRIGNQPVNEYRLKESTLTPKGAVYVDVGVFRLEK